MSVCQQTQVQHQVDTKLNKATSDERGRKEGREGRERWVLSEDREDSKDVCTVRVEVESMDIAV